MPGKKKKPTDKKKPTPKRKAPKKLPGSALLGVGKEKPKGKRAS